ncbi:hypothetical protein J1N35_022126 [Gossypium stocksii]|uniref:Prolamin-like domain-containing protein n=1 Tax=Gossypium stocksii TaxID=47602 RepID=A0A9D3VFV6_9ROSI|nr:hypothetical protein J1N35_022126 [Gossypium stocksii]
MKQYFCLVLMVLAMLVPSPFVGCYGTLRSTKMIRDASEEVVPEIKYVRTSNSAEDHNGKRWITCDDSIPEAFDALSSCGSWTTAVCINIGVFYQLLCFKVLRIKNQKFL